MNQILGNADDVIKSSYLLDFIDDYVDESDLNMDEVGSCTDETNINFDAKIFLSLNGRSINFQLRNPIVSDNRRQTSLRFIKTTILGRCSVSWEPSQLRSDFATRYSRT